MRLSRAAVTRRVMSVGWILAATAVLFALLPSPALAQDDACYSGDMAYLAGNMKIRENPTTSSSVVVIVGAGDSFEVEQSVQGEEWCWLEVELGWMAKTFRVQPTMPTFAPAASQSPQPAQEPAQQPADVDNCCFVNRQCDTDDEWERGYWAYQNNQCPVGASTTVANVSPVTAPAPQEPPPTRGEGGLQPIPGSGGAFYEFLGEGEYTTVSIPLAAGTWNLRVITAATTLAYAESPVDKCLAGWRKSRALVASKYHNIFGGNNEASGQFAVTRDCYVRFYIWAPRHRWSLEVSKA